MCWLAEVWLGRGCCGLVPGVASRRSLPVAVSVLPPLSYAGPHSVVVERAGAGWLLPIATAGGKCVLKQIFCLSLSWTGEAPHWAPDSVT